MRAVRGIGQGMEVQREAGLMAKGTRGEIQQGVDGHGGSVLDPPGSEPEEPEEPAPITLEQAGIDKHLTDKARKSAARTDEEFEFAPGIPVYFEVEASPVASCRANSIILSSPSCSATDGADPEAI
jgi:hypothetical protein